MIRTSPVSKYFPPHPYNKWERTLLSLNVQLFKGTLLLFKNEEGWTDLDYLKTSNGSIQQLVTAILEIWIPAGYSENKVDPSPENVQKLIQYIFRLAELEVELGLDMNVFCANPEVRGIVHALAVGILGEDYDKADEKSDFYLKNATIVRL